MSKPAIPTIVRYERVEKVLSTEPLFTRHQGPKSYEVVRKSGEKVYFSKEVVAVVLAIHDSGFDAHKCLKETILEYAADVLKDKGGKGESAKSQMPVVPMAGKPRRSRSKSSQKTAKKSIQQPHMDGSQQITDFNEGALAQFKNDPRFSISCSVLSMLTSAHQLAWGFDNTPGCQARLIKLEELIQEYEPQIYTLKDPDAQCQKVSPKA